MSWFKVDDKLHSHPKVLSLPEKVAGDALRLWLMAGSWCSDQLTDGRVEPYMLRVWGADMKAVNALVAVRLWDADGDGWVFHNWARYNPTKAAVLEERRKTAARVAKSRANRTRPVGNGEVTAATESVTPPVSVSDTNAAGHAGSNGASHAVGTPVDTTLVTDDVTALPTPLVRLPRPDPSRNNNKTPRSEPVAAQAEPVASAPGENKTPTDAETAARALFRAVSTNGNRPASITESQLKQAGYLLRDHPLTEVLETIAWCQQDPTWHSNVLGMNDLRRHYDKLQAKLKAEAGGGPAPKSGRAGAMAKGRAMDARLAGEFDRDHRPARPSVVGVLG